VVLQYIAGAYGENSQYSTNTDAVLQPPGQKFDTDSLPIPLLLVIIISAPPLIAASTISGHLDPS
jgi:hypothetical protein